MEIPNLWFWVWVIVADARRAGGDCAFLLILWLLRGTRRSSCAAVIPIVPHERARLNGSRKRWLCSSQPRPFCILVSDTIRQYLEERFNFHAPERTTEEFLHELQATDLLLPDQKTSLGDFLAVCDMVKFARYEPGRPELEALYESAVRLIDETEPQPAPAETTATQPASA